MSQTSNKTSPSVDGFESFCNSEKPRVTTKESDTCYEVFRNNTTAVEVIVKSAKSAANLFRTDGDYSLNSLATEEEDRNKSQVELQLVRVKKVVWHLKSQLETSTRREMQYQTENTKLRLENAKLKTLIESKTDSLSKLKRDIDTLKRSLKLALKALSKISKYPENSQGNSYYDYDEFTSVTNKDFQAFTRQKFDNSVLVDSAISKEFDFNSTPE